MSIQAAASSSSVQGPTYHVAPNVLSLAQAQTLKGFMNNSSPVKQWYGRTTYWKKTFEFKVKGQNFDGKHTQKPLKNEAVNELISLFLRTISQQFKQNLEGHTCCLAIYIDRNDVTKATADKSTFDWHQDLFISTSDMEEDLSKGALAHYSMVYLMSDESTWTGGDMHLRYKVESEKSSKAPEVTVKPKLNQAIIFENIHSEHNVECIQPVNESVTRDVFLITCIFQKQ